MKKPRVFIGSSTENSHIAYAIHSNIEKECEPTPWDMMKKPPKTFMEVLCDEAEEYDFAIMVLTPNDLIEIRDKKQKITRDNIIFELGLFVGILGRERTFSILPEEINNTRFPTDLIGLTTYKYYEDRTDNNWKAALLSPCNEIKSIIKELGPRSVSRRGDLNCKIEITDPADDFVNKEYTSVSGIGAFCDCNILLFTWLKDFFISLQKPELIKPYSDGKWTHPNVHLSHKDVERKVYALAIHSEYTNTAREILSEIKGGSIETIIPRVLREIGIPFQLSQGKRLIRKE